MEWLDILQKTLISGGVLYLLVDRFARTREQRGTDSAGMVQQIDSAFEKTLETVMTYSQGVIDKMRENDERDEKIVSGFVWRDMQVWLSSENQFNYKAAYDLAVQTKGGGQISRRYSNLGITRILYTTSSRR